MRKKDYLAKKNVKQHIVKLTKLSVLRYLYIPRKNSSPKTKHHATK